MTESNIKVKNLEVTILPDGRMKAKDAATYLGLSDKSLATMRSLGTGPKFIKRGLIFYFLEDLDEWIRSAERLTSTSQIEKQPPLCMRPR